MNALTAAHRTLPFGTRVRVHNVDNSRSVIVRINDRGPFVADRVIDVSRAAARALGLIGPGLARVRLEILAASEPVESQPGEFAVQVGAFREQENAQRLRREMEKAYGRAVVLKLERDPVLWRVLAGSFATLEGAEALARRIRDQESPALPGAFAVRVDGTP